MLKWYVYGEVYFTGTGVRNGARNRLNNFASRQGFVAEAWQLLIDTFGTWPAGNITITGLDDNGNSVPGLRFCYATTDPAQAEEVFADIASAWTVFQDTNSWWAYATVTV